MRSLYSRSQLHVSKETCGECGLARMKWQRWHWCWNKEHTNPMPLCQSCAARHRHGPAKAEERRP